MVILQSTGTNETLNHETIDQVKRFIESAGNTTPDNGTGYGLALVALIFMAIAAIGIFVWRTKVQDKKDRESKGEISEQIQRLGIEYRAEISAAEKRLAEQIKGISDRVESNGDKLNNHGERIAKLEP